MENKNLKTMLSSQDMTWETPQYFFNELNKEFQFTLDPCATEENAKCRKYFMKASKTPQNKKNGVKNIKRHKRDKNAKFIAQINKFNDKIIFPEKYWSR